MDISSIDISPELLEALDGMTKEEADGFVRGLRFDVAEATVGTPASFAGGNGVVGVVVLNGEDGSSTVLTLKRNSD